MSRTPTADYSVPDSECTTWDVAPHHLQNTFNEVPTHTNSPAPACWLIISRNLLEAPSRGSDPATSARPKRNSWRANHIGRQEPDKQASRVDQPHMADGQLSRWVHADTPGGGFRRGQGPQGHAAADSDNRRARYTVGASQALAASSAARGIGWSEGWCAGRISSRRGSTTHGRWTAERVPTRPGGSGFRQGRRGLWVRPPTNPASVYVIPRKPPLLLQAPAILAQGIFASAIGGVVAGSSAASGIRVQRAIPGGARGDMPGEPHPGVDQPRTTGGRVGACRYPPAMAGSAGGRGRRSSRARTRSRCV